LQLPVESLQEKQEAKHDAGESENQESEAH
jgi:hypothetical protein